jgi:signal transduction histidine kinase
VFTTLPERQAAQFVHLRAFLIRLISAASIFGILESLAFVFSQDTAFAIASLTTFGCLGCFLIAQAQLKRGRMQVAAIVTYAAFLAAAIVGGLVWPNLLPMVVLLPLLALVIILPYIHGRTLYALIVIGWLVILSVAIVDEVLPPSSSAPSWLISLFRVSSLVTAMALLLFLLVQFSNRLLDMLRATEQANAALQATQAELERQRDHLAVALNEREAAVALHRSIEERLVALTEAAGRLLSSPSQYDVLPAILDLSRQLVAADAYAVWRGHPSSSEWQVVCAVGLSESFQETVARSPANTRTIPTQPVVIPDVAALPALTAHRMENYRREGIQALLVMPLRIHGEITATLVFYYHQPQPLSELEVRVATALAHLSGAALTTAELYDEQHQRRMEAEAAQRDQAFLAQASGILGNSLDYTTTLTTIAELAVPQLGDWCGVYLLNKQGTVEQLAVAHHDPAKTALVHELLHRYPPTPERAHGLMRVLQTGQPVLAPQMDASLLETIAQDAEHLRLLRELDVTSYLLVPLRVGERTFGVLSFGRGNAQQPFGPEHLPLTQELAHRAAIAVENARLYRAAQDAIQLREQFLSVAAHELKTPLTTLKGYAELLQRRVTREGTFSQRDTRALQTVVEHAHRLDTLIAMLLDVSRLEAGRLRIGREVVDLHTLTGRVITEMQLMAEQHPIELTGRDEPLTVIGDELRLEQVLNNLIGNAIKYSPAGGPITVDLEQQDGMACVSVSDRGMGIPTHALPHLFERFYRADNVDERHISGMGIGLYVVKEIVTLHAGRVTVESAEGQGSTFRVSLPLAQVDGPAAAFQELPYHSD